MDQVSPALVDAQLQASGWEKAKSPLANSSETSTLAAVRASTAQGPLSSAISAATVALLEEDHISNTNSPAPSVVVEDVDEMEIKTELEPELPECGQPVEMVPGMMPVGDMVSSLAVPSMQSPITVSLESNDLWTQFYEAGTEMIITKTGRRMFPSIVVSLDGLDPELKYSVSLEVNPADQHRYKFVNSRWVFAGKGESHDEGMLVFNHPESPATGKHWTKNKVSFKKIKLSNNRNNKKGQVVALNSMHKYLPRVIISRVISKKKSVIVHSEDLERCSFVAVTAYQNDAVTQLKIDYNPFAKAFRDSSVDQQYANYGSCASGQGMMGAWPPLSPLLSPYGDCTQSLLSPGSIPSPLPQFNTAFGNFESPPYSPSYRHQPHNSMFQQPMFGLGQQRPSPLPRFSSVFNSWDTQSHSSQSTVSSLNQHPQSAFMVPRIEPNSVQPPNNMA